MENLSILFKSFSSFEMSSEYFETSAKHQSEEYRKVMEELLKYYLRYNISNVQLEDTAKLMNVVPNGTVKLPTTKYLITKEFFENHTFECFKHVKCVKCKTFIKSNFFLCEPVSCECGSVINFTEDNYFVSFKIEKQIKKIFQEYSDEITEFLSEECENNLISDVVSGLVSKRIRKNCQKYLSITFNSDGVSLQKSNTSSLWPIQLLCNFLPPKLRYRRNNIMIAGLYYGKHKPNFTDFLRPLGEEITELQTSGIAIEDQHLCVFVTHASLDLPAKADVQNTVHHNGYYACMFCYHPGELIGTRVKYTYKPHQYRPRTDKEMIQLMNEVHANKELKLKNGIKGISPTIIFKNFDQVWSFGIDYMHCVLLGVVPDLLDFWLHSSSHKNAFYIVKNQRDRLNKRMESIKLPRSFSRRIRSTDYRAQYKANELRSLLLYVLRVCLDGILDSKYVNHFQLLSAALYILLKTKITDEELEIASNKLDEFVKNFEKYYGKSKMTLNVHLLTHLVESTKHLGPLWSHSMFAFEDNNAKLASYVNGTTCVLHQISKKYLLEHAERERNVHQNDLQCELINPKYIISPSDKEFFDQEGFQEECEFEGFTRFRFNQMVFTSTNYRKAEKTIDYFVQLNDQTFAKIIFYFKCHNCFRRSEELAVIESFGLCRMVDHMYVLEKTNIKKVISVTSIKEKFIYFNIDQNHYATKVPNYFEKD